jgi:hypothetical protein
LPLEVSRELRMARRVLLRSERMTLAQIVRRLSEQTGVSLHVECGAGDERFWGPVADEDRYHDGTRGAGAAAGLPPALRLARLRVL